MNLGVCYYPEHWNEDTWQPDAKRMKELGLTWVRIGEFAWSRIEPEEGRLELGWLDRSIDTLGEAGLQVVLGTPTPTPPKWLIDKYDDVLQVDEGGRVRKFGSRRHYCFNSASYWQETERIVTLLAERYGKHEAVGAWQTDNEYGCHDTIRCYCKNCERAFRVWLERKYGDIAALNEAWWNVFWSMEYRSFSEVDLPNLTVTEANPSHKLDFYRFSSDSVIDYDKLQCDLIRQHSDKPITHNAMIYFSDLNYHKLAQNLDILTWDNYPLGMLETGFLSEDLKTRYLRTGHPDLISLMHDLYYGAKRKPFWVMEQQPGQVNWATSNPLPAKGAVRLWSHQAFAHGAEVVAYFRWRAAQGAQELMHAGLNLHDGSADRASEEAKEVAEEISGVSDERVDAPVALLFDVENLWATQLQPHAQGWNLWTLLFSYYTALRGLGLEVSVLHPSEDLSAYKVTFAPALHLVDEALAEHLTDYVKAGSHLVMGPRSGAKTLTNLAQAPAPGPLAKLMGVRIDHVDGLRPGVQGEVELGGERYSYHTWADLLTPTSADVLATYQTDAYVGTPAVTRHKVGEGHCTVLGMWGDEALHQALFAPLLEAADLSLTPLPEGVRLTRRGTRGCLMNFNPQAVTLSDELAELTGQRELAPHDVLLFER